MKKLLYVSDIMGTIDSASDQDLEELANRLNQLKEKHGVEEVLFSLCTGDSANYLKYYYDRVKPILEKHGIKLVRQYCAYAYIEENFNQQKEYRKDKVEAIIDYTKNLQKEDEIIAVYYVDDKPSISAINGYIESELDNKVYYHFINPSSNQYISSYNYSSSKNENIKGVIQSLDFHLGNVEIKTAYEEFWNEQKRILKEKEELQKREEEKRKQKEQKENDDRLEFFNSRQFLDIPNKKGRTEYNKWIKEIKNKFFSTIPSNLIFSENYKELLNNKVTPEWHYKANLDSYSLYEIIKVFGYMDLLTIMLLYCDNVRIKEEEEDIDSIDFDSKIVFYGDIKFKKQDMKAFIAQDGASLYIKDKLINMMEFLMRKEKISLYSLIDTLIIFFNNYYGKIEVDLRENYNINENLIRRLIEVRNSEQYINTNVSDLIAKHDEYVLKKMEGDLPF